MERGSGLVRVLEDGLPLVGSKGLVQRGSGRPVGVD